MRHDQGEKPSGFKEGRSLAVGTLLACPEYSEAVRLPMLQRLISTTLLLISALLIPHRTGYALAIDPARNVEQQQTRLPLPIRTVGPTLILFGIASAELFPECEAADFAPLPVIMHIFVPSEEGESAIMIAEVVCIEKTPQKAPQEISFDPRFSLPGK